MRSRAPDPTTAWHPWFEEKTSDDYSLPKLKKFEAAIRRVRFGLISWGFFKEFDSRRQGNDQATVGLATTLAAAFVFCVLLAWLSTHKINTEEAESDGLKQKREQRNRKGMGAIERMQWIFSPSTRTSRIFDFTLFLAIAAVVLFVLTLSFTSIRQIVEFLFGLLFMHMMVRSTPHAFHA
jgi:hypothetical protein